MLTNRKKSFFFSACSQSNSLNICKAFIQKIYKNFTQFVFSFKNQLLEIQTLPKGPFNSTGRSILVRSNHGRQLTIPPSVTQVLPVEKIYYLPLLGRIQIIDLNGNLLI